MKKESTLCDVVSTGSGISSPNCVLIGRKLGIKPSDFYVPFYLAMQIKSKETRGPSTFFSLTLSSFREGDMHNYKVCYIFFNSVQCSGILDAVIQ